MKKLRYIVKTIVYSILLLMATNGFAQTDRLIRAQQLLNAKNVDVAKLAIDSVIQHPDTKNDYVSYTTRAFIYFEIYKRTDKQKLYSPLRDTIISSLLKSNKLKPDADYETNNKKLLTNLSISYYNLAKILLQDSINYKRSLIAYTKYKEVFTLADSKALFTTKDAEYYAAVGSTYSDIYNKDNTKTDAEETAKIALMKVLELQPDNRTANMNMGLMYYNKAVNLIKNLGPDNDISQIDVVQENSIKLAKQAEQFILKVYRTDNKNPKAVEALYYIYRMLNDTVKTAEFKTKCKELNLKVD